MAEGISILDDRVLEDPVLVAAWPGMGLVGLRTVTYLLESLPHRKIAIIERSDCFRIPGVQVNNGLISPVEPARSEFFSCRPEGTSRDLVLLAGQAQPAEGKELFFADLVLDVACRLGVGRVFTAAAMATSVQHNHPSRLWIAATDEHLLSNLPDLGQQTITEGSISGMNGVLLGAASARGIEGYCLLGEIPYYVTNIENPKATAVILEFLSTLLDFEIDLSPILRSAAYIEAQIDNAVRQVKIDAGKAMSESTGQDTGQDGDDEGKQGLIN